MVNIDQQESLTNSLEARLGLFLSILVGRTINALWDSNFHKLGYGAPRTTVVYVMYVYVYIYMTFYNSLISGTAPSSKLHGICMVYN